VNNASGYKWNTTNNYSSATDLGTVNTKTETGLVCNTNYTRYLWSYNNCGNSESVALNATTQQNPPSSPLEGTHVPGVNQIIWNWNPVVNAIGYKWNTINNFITATDLGLTVSKTEVSLSCNTNYIRYVWAYNDCGNSTNVVLTSSTLVSTASPVVGTHIPSQSQIIWNWNTVNGASGYKWNTVNDYASAIDLGTYTSKTEISLTCNTSYTRYVWSYNTCGHSVSLTMIQTTLTNPPASPTEGVHIANATQITWNWNAVTIAAGYKWNSVNNYATAIDLGNVTSRTELGLTPNTTYTRYVWAYNSCGISSPTILTKTLPFLIGQTFGGGVIFYVDGSGQHGMISATNDQNTYVQWGCSGTSVAFTNTGIGSGSNNTYEIVNHCTVTGIAARICFDLVLNGYSDWYLPSKDELYQMFIYKSAIGNFEDDMYWSSSEYDTNPTTWVWYTHFSNGYQSWLPKSVNYHVRAIRSF
jgi:hypothetical protein